MRLIHLTDPHLSSLEGISFKDISGKRWSGYLSWRRKRRHQHRMEMLARITAAVQAEQPDLIVVTGDLAHIGLETEVRQIRAWLAELGPPEQVLVIPGNHDIYHRSSWHSVNEYWGAYLHLQSGKTEPHLADNRDSYPASFSMGDISVVSLSSALPTRVFSATGSLGEGQTERLNHMLSEQCLSKKFCCLLVHHPPLPGMIDARKALSDAASLEAVLQKHPVNLVLHGHNHRNSKAAIGTTRIFSTNSASSVIENRPACYRVFTVERAADGWSVDMQLKKLAPDDKNPIVIESESW